MKIKLIILIILSISFFLKGLAQKINGNYLYRFYGGRIELQIKKDSTVQGLYVYNADSIRFNGKIIFLANKAFIEDYSGKVYKKDEVIFYRNRMKRGENLFYKITLYRRIFKKSIPVKYPDF